MSAANVEKTDTATYQVSPPPLLLPPPALPLSVCMTVCHLSACLLCVCLRWEDGDGDLGSGGGDASPCLHSSPFLLEASLVLYRSAILSRVSEFVSLSLCCTFSPIRPLWPACLSTSFPPPPLSRSISRPTFRSALLSPSLAPLAPFLSPAPSLRHCAKRSLPPPPPSFRLRGCAWHVTIKT